MTIRTTRKSVTFVNSFVLGDFGEVLPPGTYDVETDEQLLDALSLQAYRRVRSLIHLPAKSGNLLLSRTLIIDPSTLDAALKRDEASSTSSSAGAPVQTLSKGTLKTHEADSDRQAVDRAEYEGMIVHSH